MKRIFSLLLCFCMMLSICACGQKAVEISPWQEQYDLGIRYLSEGNYEEAIIAFTTAIEIDPKRPEAYQKAAEAYEGMGDMESAIAILKQGVDATADESLKDLLEQWDPPQEEPEFLPSFTVTDITPEGIHMVVSLIVPNLKNSYPVNKAETPDNGMEYCWWVSFDDMVNSFQAGTTHFKYPGSAPRNSTLYEMQADLWHVEPDGGGTWVTEAELTIDGTTLTWAFILPAEYNFDLDHMRFTEPVVRAE